MSSYANRRSRTSTAPRWARRASGWRWMLALGVLLPASPARGAGAEESPLEWVRAAFGTPPQVTKADGAAGLVVVSRAPDVQAMARSEQIVRALAGAGRGAGGESVCLAVADAKGARRVSRAVLTGGQFNQLSRAIPALEASDVGMALNLQAAGLTGEREFLAVQPTGEARSEVLAMAATGTVRLTVKLSKAPSPEQTALARIDTDKGPLGLRMVLERASLDVSDNALVFYTPSRASFSVPLSRVPRLREVVAALVTPGGLVRLAALRLTVGTDARAGFVVDIGEEEVTVGELSKRVGAIPVDSAGRALGKAVHYDWSPVLRVAHALGGECRHTLTLLGVGEQRFVRTLEAYYPGDEALIDRVLEFDPATQLAAERFSEGDDCASEPK